MAEEDESITRRVVREETIKIPPGYVRCPSCKGKGMRSAYDRGVRSLTHSPRLAAPEQCFHCNGRGYVDERLV